MKKEIVKGVKFNCGHIKDVETSSPNKYHYPRQNPITWDCDDCRIERVKVETKKSDELIAKARSIMEAKGFFNCTYMSQNSTNEVEVGLWLKVT